MEKKNEFFGQICLLVTIGVLVLGYDIWQVATDNVDLNKHMPFLVPCVFAIMTGIVLRIKYYVEQTT
jgi:hypothetical protein